VTMRMAEMVELIFKCLMMNKFSLKY